MKLDTHTHIDESDQLRYVDGELDEHDVEIVEEHLESCLRCRDALDDLAEASDSLRAFLHQADFQPRALTYAGARRRRGWAGPWGIAAALVVLFGGVAPAVYMRARGPRPLTPAVLERYSRGVPLTPERAARLGRSVPDRVTVRDTVVVIPSDRTVVVAGDTSVAWDDAISVTPVAEVFAIELTSWQSGGMLRLVFEDAGMVSYRTDDRRTTASISADEALMLINTTPGSRANHEIRVPADRAGNLVVRVAGEVIPLEPAEFHGQGVVVGGTHSATSGRVRRAGNLATIDLRRPRGGN